MKINICTERENFYTQLNNEVEPYIACQCTTMIAGLIVGGFGLEPILALRDQARFKQPEDKLRHYMLNDDDIQAFCKRSHPDSNLPAPEWADVMIYAIRKLYGKSIVYFVNSFSRQDIEDDLQKGLPIYTSMKYPENKNSAGKLSPIAGHIVLIVGIDGTDTIINDPYKNHLTGHWDGFNNVYTEQEFKRHNKIYAIRYRRDV